MPPEIKREAKRQLSNRSFWYRQHYKLPFNDPRFLDSCAIDWTIDFEGVEQLERHIEELANKEKGQETYHSDIDLSEVEVDEKFWSELDNRHGRS